MIFLILLGRGESLLSLLRKNVKRGRDYRCCGEEYNVGKKEKVKQSSSLQY